MGFRRGGSAKVTGYFLPAERQKLASPGAASSMQVAERLAKALGRVWHLAFSNGGAIAAVVDGVHHGERAADAKDEAKEYREHRRPEDRHADGSLQGDTLIGP
jgi:hypothetical protein